MNACDSWCYCSSWMPVSLGPPLLTWVSLRSIGCSLALSYCYYRSNTGYCSISRQADSNWRYKWQRSNKRRYVNLLNITHIMLLRVILLSALVEAVHQSINQSINQSIDQSINQYVKCPGGQLGPNRQKVQLSEVIQSKFASYMQAFPKEITTCIWFTQRHKVCNSTTVLQEVQML